MNIRKPALITSFHEAGHAVAAWLVGEAIHAVHAATGDGRSFDRKGRQIRGAHGLTEMSLSLPLPGLREHLRSSQLLNDLAFDRHIRRNIFVLLAGDMAEARLGRRTYDAILIEYALAIRFAFGIAEQ